ncbi:F-box domain-containing protein [Pseudovirgaria hyperparasitica]|uniref:F-box domain-containing protein n=1 Tax=Pseudovirgaria hyperparasitica TaxID=470096 RepID=A0A6A6WFQ5_9PEZI|nr:F-box domain-containing protein [Pseudovirgaria hyperparasitica]KAF2760736.1 F-box domain-containing protein [Pseudovirgaria hyperparasitica]
MTSIVRLETLPTELLESIFSYLPPESILAFQYTCKRIASIGNEPSLWKRHCEEGWRYWHPKHDIVSLLRAPVDTVDWRALFRRRKETDRFISQTLSSILASQQARSLNTKKIVELGYDAKEELLRQCKPPIDSEDFLARKYYSSAALNCIHRSVAIQEWLKLRNACDVPLENALAAFDMFVLGNESADIQEVAQTLDSLAAEFRTIHPDHGELSTRQRAVTLANFLRLQSFCGVNDESYKNMENNFIGLALRDPQHEALPLITVAIFCAVARRLGLDASCCGYPFHIYAIVSAPDEQDLDGKQTNRSDAKPIRPRIYLDPFRSDVEISEHQLRRTLDSMGVRSWNHDEYLSPASVTEMVLRSTRNLQRAVQEAEMPAFDAVPVPGIPNQLQAWYSVIWANVTLTTGLSDGEAFATNELHLRQTVSLFTSRFQPDQPWDLSLMEMHLLPLFKDLPGEEELEDFIRVTNDVDSMPKRPIRRTASKVVTYKVGQLFSHRKYAYEGAVIGWDPVCEAGEDWIQRMKVDTTLSRGRHQSFYHVAVRDGSIRYVAEENINPSEGPPSERMLSLAGRWFKRWSDEHNVFVSNVRDEYPDD